VELIGGEIARQPMTRFAHAAAQSNTRGGLQPFTRGSGPGGSQCNQRAWIVVVVVVGYSQTDDCGNQEDTNFGPTMVAALRRGCLGLGDAGISGRAPPGGG
jgi:hypothetical protein